MRSDNRGYPNKIDEYNRDNWKDRRFYLLLSKNVSVINNVVNLDSINLSACVDKNKNYHCEIIV